MHEPEQGKMTSPTLTLMLEQAALEAHPELNLAGLEKEELLARILSARGWRAVLELGRQIKNLTEHPLIGAIVASAKPLEILARWMRLERFGHTRNRIALDSYEERDAHVTMNVLHVARDRGHIAAVNDLFVWGLLIGLMEGARLHGIEATIISPADGASFSLWGDDVAPHDAGLPVATHTLRLRVSTPAVTAADITSTRPDAMAPEEATGERLRALIASDLLMSWTIADAASELALSTRSLQRSLREEGTTFSRIVRRARVDAARELMAHPQLRLIDIAFCVGFADQAHFTRAFRAVCDVPPSAFRDILP